MELIQLEGNNVVKTMPRTAHKNTSKQNKIRILEIGCGWGSFLLYASAIFPSLEFVGFSNSSTQIAYIQSEARRKGLDNVIALKLDINDFCDSRKRNIIPQFAEDKKFSRIISIECLEHRLVIF